jgi:putative restriction endonuclease
MTPEELKNQISNVKRWSRGDQRAPNKPLMMAYALAKYIQGHKQMFSYEDEVDKELGFLLRRFGPSRKSYHPEYPFWRLLNDNIWRLDNAGTCLPRKSNKDPAKSELIKHGVTGGFSDEAYQLLKDDAHLVMELLETILIENFPDSLIPEITAQLGLDFTFRSVQKRDPNFRREVLNAYNGKCAICGFDARLNDDLFALEAAHIKWKQFNGPCTVSNGLALCSIHHKALDKGAITITPDMKVKVSTAVIGAGIVKQFIWSFENNTIQLPRQNKKAPLEAYLQWHQENVFIS